MNPSTDCPNTISPQLPAIEACIGSRYRALFQAVKELSAARGVAVYLVGGPVRDWLLRRPVQDLDFVVEGDAPGLARSLARRLGGRAVVHPRFGTANLWLDAGRVDLVTARREEYPRPGALPKVTPAALADDLARRDFSINAMAVSLTGAAPSLYDPLDGREDLARGLIRILHPASFRDDPTRLFRAVRYEQRLGFRLEQETAGQLATAVAAGNCDAVTGDRLRHELSRIFEEPTPGKILERAVDLRLLAALFPSLNRKDCIVRWAAASTEIDPSGESGNLVWLAALAYPLTEGEGEGLIRRLNLPAVWAQIVRDAVELRQIEATLAGPELRPSDICRLLDGKRVESLYLAAALADLPAAAENLRRYLGDWRNIDTALKGRDLLDLGVPSGPQLGRTLAGLRTARLDHRVSSEAEERQWVKEMIAAEYDSVR